MNKAEKRFRLYALLVIFVLLTVLLAVINGMSFTMAAQDADELTQRIADRQGSFERAGNMGNEPAEQPPEKGMRMGPMGPDSPEMDASIRYFTVAFSNKGKKVETVAYHISAVSETKAIEWASELVKGQTGWTRGTYRYRVYQSDGVTYVTVIDQGRELLPSYRILLISAAGEALVLLLGWFLLRLIGRKLYAPIEEADRNQKNFIQKANKEFRLPLTIIGANVELAERRYGPDDETRSTRRQLVKLNELVEKLGTMGMFEDETMRLYEVPVSEYVSAALDEAQERFAARGVALSTHITPDVQLTADPEAIKRLIDEIVDNAQKYALTKARFTLARENGYVLLEAENDADLPDGPADQVFDRFTVLSNAPQTETGAGLGLAHVKEIVKAHKGRVSATVLNGVFTMRITL